MLANSFHAARSTLRNHSFLRRGGGFLLQWLRRTMERLRRKERFGQGEQLLQADDDNFRQTAFTFAVIALAAKLAKADGKVKKEEFLAFCELFPLPHEDHTKIHRLFIMACRDPADASHYARQIVHLFHDRSGLLRELVVRLCQLAKIDGPVTAEERRIIETVADLFNVSRNTLRTLLTEEEPVSVDDPYRLLGVSPRATPKEIKKAYRERIRILHPDQLAARGYAPEDIARANAALVRLNEAYSMLSKKRRVK